MPSHYAHYRFGAQAIACMSPDVRRHVQRFRQLYDVGLHGPDPFFYHNIFLRDSTVELGSKFHRQTGEEFFARICRKLRLEPNEAGLSYLYGVLAHYCLDSVCHPFIKATAEEGTAGHTELETEFDRYLLTLDGKKPAHTFDCSRHMKLTPGECKTVADFYPPATPAAVGQSVKSMAFCVKTLAAPGGIRKNGVNLAVKLSSGRLASYVMKRIPNPRCSHLDEQLLALYDQALEKYPRMLDSLQAHLSHNVPLGEDFMHPFG